MQIVCVRWGSYGAVVGMALGLLPRPSAAQALEDAFAPDRLTVVVRETTRALPTWTGVSGPLHTGDAALDELLARFGARTIRSVAGAGGSLHRDPVLLEQLGLDRHYVIVLDAKVEIEEAEAAFAAHRWVETVTRVGIMRACGNPNDPMFPWQWGLKSAYDHDIDFEMAWPLSTEGNGVTIAILDTGIDLDHPELVAGIVAGFDFVNFDSNANDESGHGTSCAGIAAARTDNGLGIAGVAGKAALMPVMVLDSRGFGTWPDLASGIVWAVDHGAAVISMSLAGYGFDD